MDEFSESCLEPAIEMFDEDDYIGTIACCSNIINFLSEMSLYSQARSDAFFYRGFSQLLLKNYILAIRDLDQSIKLNSEVSQVDEATTYSLRADAKKELNLLHSAISDYSMAIKLDPEDTHSSYCRAVSKIKLARELREDSHKKPNHSDYLFKQVVHKKKLGYLESALNELNYLILKDAHYYYYEERYKLRKTLNDLKGAEKDWIEMRNRRDQSEIKEKSSYSQLTLF